MKTAKQIFSILLALTLSLAATGPAAVSNIGSVGGVPLIVLNNGVEVPQLGLGTQIQRLEGDSSESGRLLFHP